MTEMDQVHEAGEGEDGEREQARDEADRRAASSGRADWPAA